MTDVRDRIPQAHRGPTHDERVLELLSDREPHSHHELYALHVIGHSRIASLRAKGHRIDAWRDADTYMYRLVGMPEEAAAAAPAGRAAASSDIPAHSDPPPADWGDGMSEPVQLELA